MDFEIIGHRGDPSCAIENSYDAFSKAILHGVCRVELDIWRSKDGGFYISHDDSLGRVTGVDVSIRHSLSSELNKMKLPNGEKLPELRKVLERFGGEVEFNLEVKFEETCFIKPLLSLVQSLDPLKRILWSSFNLPILYELKNQQPSCEVAVLIGPDSSNENVSPSDAESLGTKIIHPWVGYLPLDKSFEGYKIYPYCGMKEEAANKEKVWQTLLESRVNGFCTNFPGELKKWLNGE